MADRTVNVKLRADVAQYMASMRAAGNATRDLEKAARDVRKAHDEEATAAGRVRVAEAKLNDLRADSKTKVSQLAVAEEQLAKAHRSLEVAQDNTSAATARFTKAQAAAGDAAGQSLGDGVAGGIDRSSGKIDAASEKVAERTQAKFKALQFAGAFAGLPVAAAVGAAGVGVALAGVPLLFTGIAAVALKSNEQVASSSANLKTRVVADTQAMAAPMAGPLTGAINDVSAAWVRMTPQVRAAMLGSVPAVGLLTGAVTDFAENAMPGMVVAVKSSVPPLEGLRSAAGQVGAGWTDMATNMTTGSQGAKVGIVQLGGAARDLMGFTGSLLAEFANGSAGVLPQFRATLGQLEGTVLSLAHGAMPALQGASSGFMGTVGGMLSIVQGAAGVLGSWAAPLGSMGGSLFATNSVARMFGTSLGQTGFGLKAFATEVDAAGNKTSPFRTALANTEAGGSKLSRGLNSVVSSGVNPLGLALVAGGFVLDAFGQAQQRAAEAAAAHRENVRTLTDAIRQDGGVLGAHTQAVNVDVLTTKNAAANLGAYGQSLEVAKLAVQGNVGAYNALQTSATNALTTIAKSAGASDDQARAFGGLAKTSLETGKTYSQLDSEAKALLTTSTDMGDATVILSAKQQNQVSAIINSTGAVREQIRAQQEAHDAYVVSEVALTGLTAAQVENRDATVKATQALYDQQNQALGYRGAVLTTQDALTAYHKTLQGGTEDAKAKALLGVERAFAAQEQAAYNAAYANSTAVAPGQRVAEAMAAQDRETVKLAGSMGGVLPASLQTTISRMSVAQAQAAGMTVAIDGAGNAVYRLPNGKEIRVSADTGQALAAIDYAARDRSSTIRFNAIFSGLSNVGNIATSIAQNAVRGRADGGLIGRRGFADGGLTGYASGGALDVTGGGLVRGPGGPRDDRITAFSLSDAEFVNNAASTSRNLAALDYANRGGTIVPDFASSVRQSIQTGGAVTGTPVAISQSSGGGFQDAGTEVRVFIGDQELTSIVRTEIRQSNRNTKRAVTAGAGAAR